MTAGLFSLMTAASCTQSNKSVILKLLNIFFSFFYLEKTFASLTGTDSIVLAGSVITTNCTATLVGSWVLRFRRHHGTLRCLGAF